MWLSDGVPRRASRPARLLVATVALLAVAARVHAVCDPPRCIDVGVPVPPGLRVPNPIVRVLLPTGYDTNRARYPVLYLLHGAGDTYATWTQNTDVQDFSADLPIIIVMPDGGRDATAGFYSDWVDGSRQWETFHTRVLVRWIDRHFRTLHGGSHRAVAGLSMCGFGAMSYAARHRRLFRAAASFSGALDTLYPTPAASILDALRVVNRGVWGDPAIDEATWRAHNPTDLAPQLRGISLFLATGDGTMGGPAGDVSDSFAYAAEQVVAQMTFRFAHALDAAGIAYASDFYRGGYHGWPYWQRELHWALPQIVSIVGSPRP